MREQPRFAANNEAAMLLGLGCSTFTLGAAQNKIERLLAAHRLPQRLAILFLAVKLGGAIAIAPALRDDGRHPLAELLVIDRDLFLLRERVHDQRRARALLGPRLQVVGALLDALAGLLMRQAARFQRLMQLGFHRAQLARD